MSADDARTPLDRLRARIHGLVNRGAEICAEFIPSVDGTVCCERCGYRDDVHLLRDVLAELEHARAERSSILNELTALVGHWRGEAAVKDSFHATMGVGWKACARDLDGLLDRLRASAQPQPEGKK